MFEAKNGRIKITKGDSASLLVNLKMASGEAYQMQAGDMLTLTVRRMPGDEKLIEIVSDSEILTFIPSYTKDLEPGAYCFDIQLTTANGDIFTVVGMTSSTLTNMTVLPEITE